MQENRRKFLQLAATLALSPAIPAWSFAAPPDLVGRTMGTSFRIRIMDDLATKELPRIRRNISNVLEDVEQRLSLYRPHSELSRLNRADAETWLSVDSATVQLLRDASSIESASQGAFCPYMASVVQRWGFGPEPVSELADLRAKRAPYNATEPRLVFDGNTVRKSSEHVAVDLNGIAKGDAVDRVVRSLQSSGVENCLVEIGGEVRCTGTLDGRSWQIGIQGPQNNIISRIPLRDAAVATSGDHIHYFELNGRRYSHLMDPLTSRPVKHDLALVSVVAANTRLADAWSTALMVLGPEAGLAAAQEQQLAALFVIRKAGGGWHINRTPAYRDLEAQIA